jgi:diguanylate cyclase (GGDEF)-like protein/PAS domain S-box-containing protein
MQSARINNYHMFSNGPLVYTKSEVYQTEAEVLMRLADSVPAMLAYWDSEQRCRFANRAYEKWYGVSPSSLIGKHLTDLLGPMYPATQPYVEAALQGIPQSFERAIPDPGGGSPRIGQADYTPDIVNGVVKGFFVVVSDISERKRLEQDLRLAHELAEARASHDPLTGLANRPLIEESIRHAMALSDRNRDHCAVFYLDMDNFKQINDSLGHAAGDAVLCQTARRLEHALRRSDIVGRMGGDEFLVVIPELENEDQAVSLGRKLLHAVAAEPLAVADRSIATSFSLGIAIYPEHGETAHDLIACADKALYEAKHAGRNTYTVGVRAHR